MQDLVGFRATAYLPQKGAVPCTFTVSALNLASFKLVCHADEFWYQATCF